MSSNPSTKLFGRKLQAQFNDEFNPEDKDFPQSLVGKHEMSDSETEGEKVLDSDGTISEDELEEIKKLLDKKVSHSATLKPHLKDTRRNEVSNSDSTTKSKLNSQTKLHEMSDSDEEDSKVGLVKRMPSTSMEDQRPLCKFGRECYRKSTTHKKMFRHLDPDLDGDCAKKKMKLEPELPNDFKISSNKFGFYLTKVSGIGNEFNREGAIDIKDILSAKMGNLTDSAQFNYMTDIEWLIQQYPQEYRTKPLLIVHGEQRESKKALTREASAYPHIKLCQAKLEIPFGTHHTKMMILLYDTGLRIVIHTANLIRGDWHQKTQGVWMSPVFPLLKDPSKQDGESPTYFKRDFLEYLSAYKANELNAWCEHIKRHDLSTANVYLIGSTPGRHTGSKLNLFGHYKLRKVLVQNGPESSLVNSDWPIIGQFSSIGSLGASADVWLKKEFLTSLSSTRQKLLNKSLPTLNLIFPTVNNVRVSLEGYPAGGCLPYANEVAKKQPWLHKFFHQWQSERLGRSVASPHIKTYTRVEPNLKSIAWFLVTSANLSKAAWGTLEKNSTQLMIRSYELGVLFLPQHFSKTKTIEIASEHPSRQFSLPFDVPLIEYQNGDEPWIWNIPHTEKPDRHGNMWCPS